MRKLYLQELKTAERTACKNVSWDGGFGVMVKQWIQRKGYVKEKILIVRFLLSIKYFIIKPELVFLKK